VSANRVKLTYILKETDRGNSSNPDHKTTCHDATVLHKNYTFCSPEHLSNNLCEGGV
jgi:hypothetical protein